MHSKLNIPQVPKTSDTKSIPKPLLANESFRFLTAYPWLKSTGALYSKDGFTNLCKDESEFSKLLTELIETVIVKVNKDFKEIFFDYSNCRSCPHCHQVGSDHMPLVNKISKILQNDNFDDIINGENDFSWWELGFKGSARIFGIFSKKGKVFYPMFVDWHHLIYGDRHYNQSDFKHYSYDPHEK